MKSHLEEFDTQVRQHFRWNFTVNTADFALYCFALSFTSLMTILPAFVNKFTSSNFVIGIIPTINVLGWLLPQLLAARYVEKFSRKKKFILIVGIGERLPWLFIALGVFLLSKASAAWNLLSFFIFYSSFCFSGGVNTPAWLDMMSKVIPERKRGRFFGLSSFIGNGMGVLGALFTGYLLERIVFPGNYAACFMLTFVFTSISLGFFALNKESAYPVVKAPSTLRNYLSQLVVIARENRNYLFFLIATVITCFSGMASSFFTVHAINNLNLPGGEIGRFTAISLFFQTVTNPMWGYMGDRWGHKRLTEVGVIGMILSSFIAVFANSAVLFYLVFAITGASLSAATIARLSIVLEFSKPEERATYIGLTNTVKAPFSAVAPILGGILGDRFQLPFVFLITSGIVFIGLIVFIFGVKEPRTQISLE